MNKKKKSVMFVDPKAREVGRGAHTNPHNRFFKVSSADYDDAVMPWQLEEEENSRTSFIEVFPKTILTKNNSPDLGFDYSINPYNGCEHGCSYCYARNTHEYWGYSAGKDFEEKILVKKNAPELLSQAFSGGKWEPQHIMFSGNTDCYQPAERKFQLTRQLLEVFQLHRHPVSLITKNALILRDLDILAPMAAENRVRVTISITTLRDDLRRVMEPRTSSVANRLRAVEELVKAGIPVNVNLAPVIYNLNSDEIFDIAREVGERGAYSLSYIMVRLNGQIGEIFENWVKNAVPERAEKVLHHIRDTHNGTLNESRFGSRMRGEGKYAEQVAATFKLARKKFIKAPQPAEMDYSSFLVNPKQLSLF